MKTDEIAKVLWELSIEFVNNNNTMIGKYTYEDLIGELYMAARRRNIIGDLQLFEANAVENYTEAVFQFSPNYLNRETEMMSNGMENIKWKLLLLHPIEREEFIDEDKEEIQNEIIEKIATSKVEIIHYEEAKEFDLNTLLNSISRD